MRNMIDGGERIGMRRLWLRTYIRYVSSYLLLPISRSLSQPSELHIYDYSIRILTLPSVVAPKTEHRNVHSEIGRRNA